MHKYIYAALPTQKVISVVNNCCFKNMQHLTLCHCSDSESWWKDHTNSFYIVCSIKSKKIFWNKILLKNYSDIQTQWFSTYF